MQTKHQVHNLIILDESGSMDSIKNSIIQGFNEIVQTVKGIAIAYPDQEHFITLISFNGLGQKILHFMDPVEILGQIDGKRYRPDASTPLYDAMGFAFAKLSQVLADKEKYNVLVTIMTDGEENASKEYTGMNIRNTIDGLKLKGWTFTYIGADHNVEKFATSISITNTMVFEKNATAIKNMFAKEKSARARYSEKIDLQEATENDFYNDKT
ncbi:MAG: VWA domain-containing protein [Saprospiraceae bacterium]|nr:VWA domain-containing protein [Saprospiraceae bacterium]